MFAGMSNLHFAARNVSKVRIKQLLAEGADITERDEYGWGVLKYAGYDAVRTTRQSLR
jgi:ankyrin repeat protein